MKNKEKHIRHRDIQDALELIGGRWRGAIMASLCASPKRFSQLKTDLSPVTAKILIKELRFLEENMMVVSHKSTAAENSVLYSLTPHGKSLEPLIIKLHEWAMEHREVMLKQLQLN